MPKRSTDPQTLKESILTKLTLLIMDQSQSTSRVTEVFNDIHLHSSLSGSIIGATDESLDRALTRLIDRRMEEVTKDMRKNPHRYPSWGDSDA